MFKVGELIYKLLSVLRVVCKRQWTKVLVFLKWEFYSWRRQIHLLVFNCPLFWLKSFEYSAIIMLDIQIQIPYQYSIFYIFSLLLVLLIFLIVANWSLQYVCTAPSLSTQTSLLCALARVVEKCAVNNILCSYFRHQYILLVWSVSVCSHCAPSAIYTCLQLFFVCSFHI